MNDYIYSDEENVSKQPQSDENLFVERRSEQPNGGPLEFAGHKLRRQRKRVVSVSEAELKKEYITRIP